MKLVWALLLLAPIALGCVVPRDGMVFSSAAQLCADVFYLDHGIVLTGSDFVLDCNGAVLKGWNGGKAVSIERASNVTVRGCRLVGYDAGFEVRNSTRIFLEDNHLVKNVIGARFVGVSDSATFNHDVSLSAPFELLESDHNALSLSNKVVEGGFCAKNFCNQNRNALSLVLAPHVSLPMMHSWLFQAITGKNSLFFRAWVRSGLS